MRVLDVVWVIRPMQMDADLYSSSLDQEKKKWRP
jgi:hypothetical protein